MNAPWLDYSVMLKNLPIYLVRAKVCPDTRLPCLQGWRMHAKGSALGSRYWFWWINQT